MTVNLAIIAIALLLIGFLAQWVAWRIRIPAILPLLLAGIIIGPVTGVFNPDEVFGDLLFPGISLAVAIILFEGSLTLRFSDLGGIGRAVQGMVSYGAVVAMVLLAVAAHWVVGISWSLAFLFGALTCVTGPTVIFPMLRTLRPNARIAKTLRWEGIIIDPLGALLAVLVFEGIVSHQQGHSLGVFLFTIVVGAAIGLLMAQLLGFLLNRQMIPEFLQTYGTLIAVLTAFGLSNILASESGLLAVTIMGIVLGNRRDVYLDHIMDFKEHLSIMLVSLLFVVLAARLSWPLPPGILIGGIVIFIIAQFVIRPVSVLIATAGSKLNWRERALISFVSPRGVVAASVSSLFALRLDDLGVAGADQLVPLVFILIIGTVVLQSLTARHLAEKLNVADPDPTGIMIFGSDSVAQTIAKTLLDQGIRVIVVDDDWDGIKAARMAGLTTFYGNPTSQHADLHLDLAGIGRLFALSSRRELNSLTCMQYRSVFERENVYKLRVLAPSKSHMRDAFAGSIQANALFDDEMTHSHMCDLLTQGWYIKKTQLTPNYKWEEYIQHNGEDVLLLFAIDTNGSLRIASNKRSFEPRQGWTVLVLVPPSAPASPPKRLMQKAVAEAADNPST